LKTCGDVNEAGVNREHAGGARFQVNMSRSTTKGVARAKGDIKERYGEVQLCGEGRL